MPNALIIQAHQVYPGISSGKLNTSMAALILQNLQEHGYDVRETVIEGGYDIQTEIDNHLWADVVILQSPVFWFGTPWIYKKYADEVFTTAMGQCKFFTGDGRSRSDPTKQYGTGGTMQGKKYMLSLTWNAPEEAFGNEDQYLFQGKTVDDVFINNTANYRFCGAEVLPSFSCFDVVKNPDIEGDKQRLKEHVAKYLA